jgi:sirohydrochlorin cobaltochelatase
MADRAIVLFAHGARDPEWAEPFKRIKRLLQARQPGVAVELAFLEIMQPSLADAIATLAGAGHTSIAIAPLFMAQGGHLKNDLPKILDGIRARHRGVKLTLLPAIGDVEPVLDAIAGWLVGAMAR